MGLKIPYGLNSYGLIVHIDSVKNGIECECVCPDCKTSLIARNGGKKYIHHFAHVNTVSCNAGETILHILAKNIFKKSRKIHLPKLNYGENLIQNEYFYHYDQCILEEKVDSIKPDLTLIDESSVLYVEIKVTHAVDESKLNKIKELNIPVVEINLSSFIDKMFDINLNEILESSLVESLENKEWLFHPKIKDFMIQNNKNKFLIKDGFFDKVTRVKVLPYSPNLSWMSSLFYLWIYNGKQPFIALNTFGKQPRFYYINKSINKSDRTCEAYECEPDDNFCLMDNVLYQEIYLECKLTEANKRTLYYIDKYQWKYIQDKPDLFLNEEEIKVREEKELEEKRERNEKKIISKIRDYKVISRARLSISEIWKLYEYRYKSVTIQNVENMDLLLIKNGKIDSDKYSFDDPNRVWINIAISIYDELYNE